MGTDLFGAAEFYASPRGAVAASLVRARIAALWPSVARCDVLGVGHVGPYLDCWREEAARCIACAPASIGPARWPAGGRSLICAGEGDLLPFPDLSFDRVLLVHGLEAADNARRMLREVWRVLRDDGRLLVVAANRRGLWAHLDSTPFGQGQPFSTGQVGRLLGASMFAVERRDSALFVPPSTAPLVLHAAPLIEQAGRHVASRFAGVTLTEAMKDCYAALPLRAVRRRFVLSEAA
jgi:SAM-dependent methyltransferase